MQKFLPLLSLVLLLATGCSPKVTPLVDDDGTDWGAAAAQYAENPAALKALVEECETKDETIAMLRRDVNSAQAMSGDLSVAQQSAAEAQQEIQQLRNQLAAAQTQRNDQVDTDQQMVRGVIYQVQLGAFAQNKVDPNSATGDALELSDQGGVQKIVVSQFRTYANAAALRDRLKQMGVRDAFVVARNNGQRIDIQEALRLSGQN